MKKNILNTLMIIAFLFSGSIIKAQQALSPNLFSQNGWMTDVVGGGTAPADSNQCPGLKNGFNLPCNVGGQLYDRMGLVQTSHARLIRFGGTTADQNNPTFPQYRRFVDSVRARGMEPVLQIPVNLGSDGTPDYDTTLAKDIIREVNGTPYNRGVVYFSIGNEPDLATPNGYGYDSAHQAIKITNYIHNFSKAMRRAVPSVPIKIIGPELAQWNCAAGSEKKNLVDSLLTPNQRCDISGKDPATGKPWINIWSWHFYGGINGDLPSTPRTILIDKLRKTNGLAETIDYLNVKLEYADSYHNRGADTLLSAITEAHIDFQDTTKFDPFSGVKCHSFFAGQYWLEIASIAAEKEVDFVNFWASAFNAMGYMKSDGTKQSTYYHFQKAAENFSGNYYTGSDISTISGTNIKNLKAFGTKDANHIAVMVMNQDSLLPTPTSRYYSIRLNGSYPTTDTNRITLSMGIDKTYHDTIQAASTTLLIFDIDGNVLKKYWYRQSQNNSPPGFIQPYCSTPVTYANQTQLDNYIPGVYSSITIGGASAISLSSTSNTIFRSTGLITITGVGGAFSTNGQPLTLIHSDCQ
jgi:hypothetical protein